MEGRAGTPLRRYDVKLAEVDDAGDVLPSTRARRDGFLRRQLERGSIGRRSVVRRYRSMKLGVQTNSEPIRYFGNVPCVARVDLGGLSSLCSKQRSGRSDLALLRKYDGANNPWNVDEFVVLSCGAPSRQDRVTRLDTFEEGQGVDADAHADIRNQLVIGIDWPAVPVS